MSEIILDTITGKSTATTITIGSTPVVSSSANSMTIRGEGSNQTSIQQGLAKAWAHYDQSALDTANRDSFNFSGVTDVSAGRFTETFTNAMSNANYAAGHLTNQVVTDLAGNEVETTAITTQSRNSSFTATDSDNNLVSVHGDLA